MTCKPDGHRNNPFLERSECVHCLKPLKHFRVTRPERYPYGTEGFKDPGSRQGHYISAVDRDEAEKGIRARLETQDPAVSTERLDVQDWSGGPEHGKKV